MGEFTTADATAADCDWADVCVEILASESDPAVLIDDEVFTPP
jgi:hypothetical protein